jgi:hypothetical protein
MRVFAAAVLLLVAFASPAGAVEIPEDCKVKNRGSFCEWCCLDTLGRIHKVEPLIGLLDKQCADYPLGFPGHDILVRGRLKALGVRHIFQKTGDMRRDLFEKYANKYGVVSSIKYGNSYSGWCHAVIVTEYSDTRVGFYCPDNTHKIWRCGRSWWDANWDGHVVVILPEGVE